MSTASSPISNYRFTDVDVPKDTIVQGKHIVPMSDISSIHEIKFDQTILFRNKQEIEKFISLYETEGNRSREDVFEFLEHFVFCRFPTVDGVMAHFSSQCFNHAKDSDGRNVMSFEENGKVKIKTVTDVKAGDELLVDYSGYGFDAEGQFWVGFCKEEGRKDFKTGMKEHEDF